MSTPFLGEMRLVAFNFPPKGWAMCDGQLLPIKQNQALFALLGTYYGGDGRTTFALPNLQGRAPLHVGQGITLGQQVGEETHTLSVAEIPAHTHQVQASSHPPNSGTPAGAVWSMHGFKGYAPVSNASMNPAGVGIGGGGQAHENRAPYLTLNIVIALQGLFPSRS